MEQTFKRLRSQELMVENGTTINDLPEAILWKIFEYLPYKTAKVKESNVLFSGMHTKHIKYSEAMLVCQHWKNVIENNLVFSRTKIFHKERTSPEYLIATKSQRKFKNIDMLITINDLSQFNLLKNVLTQSQNFLQDVNITIGDYNVALKISIDIIYGILKNCWNATKLKVYFVNVKFLGNFSKPRLNFVNLKRLDIINYKQFPESQDAMLIKCFGVLQAPELEFAQILWSSKEPSEHKSIFEFFEKISAKLKRIYFGAPTYDFSLLEERLFFRNSDWGTLQALAQLIKDISHMEMTNVDLEALSKFKDFPTFPKVRKLYLNNCNINAVNIIKLHRTFPNVEALYLGVTEELNEINKKIIRELFQNLKEAKTGCIDAGVYKNF
jgi:hypothetical protein